MILFVMFVGMLLLLLYLDYRIGRHFYYQRDRSWVTTGRAEDVTLYQSGQPLFDQIMTDMKQAEHSIDMQFFIIRHDKISNQVYQLLAEKKQQGIRTRVLADWAGSGSFRKKWVNDRFSFLKMNRPSFPFAYNLQQRNHRKVLVIDQEISYLGGYNLGDEYLGKGKKLGTWKDYHIRLKGELSKSFQYSFNEDWNDASGRMQIGQAEDDFQHHFREAIDSEDPFVILSTDSDQLEKAFLHLIQLAEKKIIIGSPYFIPTKRIFEALKNALRQGVTVELLIPEKADHLLTKAGAFPFLREMLQHGANVHLYVKGFFHGKVCFIDDTLCDIGTANFDQRSFVLNQEINLLVKGRHALFGELMDAFYKDLEESKPMTENWLRHQSIPMKVLSKLTVPIRPFL